MASESSQPVERLPANRNREPWDRDSLTDVALAVFLERGYDGTSMEDLARAAKMHKSGYYYHFPGGKEELLERGLDRALSALSRVFEEPGASSGAAVARLEYVLRRAIEIEYEMLAEVALLLRVRGNSDVERAAMARRRELTERLANLVREAIDEGAVRGDLDPDVVARLLLGVEVSMAEWVNPGGRFDGDELAEMTLALVLDGLRPRTL